MSVSRGLGRRSVAHVALALSTSLVLGACSPSLDDLQAWAEEEKRNVKLGVQPLPTPTRFYPEQYQAYRSVDPFDFQWVRDAMLKATAQSSPLFLRELRRRRQPLETFSLDQMSMVGALMQPRRTVGLVNVGGVLYQVKPGDYMGQNNGRVVKILEGQIEVLEVVQDASGRWVERATALKARGATQ